MHCCASACAENGAVRQSLEHISDCRTSQRRITQYSRPAPRSIQERFEPLPLKLTLLCDLPIVVQYLWLLASDASRPLPGTADIIEKAAVWRNLATGGKNYDVGVAGIIACWISRKVQRHRVTVASMKRAMLSVGSRWTTSGKSLSRPAANSANFHGLSALLTVATAARRGISRQCSRPLALGPSPGCLINQLCAQKNSGTPVQLCFCSESRAFALSHVRSFFLATNTRLGMKALQRVEEMSCRNIQS